MSHGIERMRLILTDWMRVDTHPAGQGIFLYCLAVLCPPIAVYAFHFVATFRILTNAVGDAPMVHIASRVVRRL